jgi:spore germination protein KC
VCALICSLSGCWDYRDLDTLSIVIGFSIDRSETDPSKYSMGFEIVDLDLVSSESDVESLLISSEGRTITECVNNMAQKLQNPMYFGNTEVGVIGHDVAQEVSLDVLLDSMLRDYELRDNLILVISAEDGKSLLNNPEEKPRLNSFKISSSLVDWKSNSSSANGTHVEELDQVYDCLSEGADLVLPELIMSDKKTGEFMLEGLAVFRDGVMQGIIEQEHVPFYLITAEGLAEGSYNIFFTDEGDEDNKYVVLSNRQSRPKISFDYSGGVFTFYVDVEAFMSVSEFSPTLDASVNSDDTKELEKLCEEILAGESEKTLYEIRDEMKADLLDFAAAVNDKAPALWSQVKDSWDDYYASCEIKVRINLHLVDTGLMQNY